MEIPKNYLENKFGKKQGVRKPATNKIFLIQQGADLIGEEWKYVFIKTKDFTENELQYCLDQAKNCGNMTCENGVWRERTPNEKKIATRICYLSRAKKIRENIKAQKTKAGML